MIRAMKWRVCGLPCILIIHSGCKASWTTAIISKRQKAYPKQRKHGKRINLFLKTMPKKHWLLSRKKETIRLNLIHGSNNLLLKGTREIEKRKKYWRKNWTQILYVQKKHFSMQNRDLKQ